MGNLPSNIGVDQATGTVYVDNEGDGTVSVFNAATCNALDTWGCNQTSATVPVGPGPQGIFVDDANHTVYVGDYGGGSSTTVSMINSGSCNASDLATCPTTAPPTVNVDYHRHNIQVDQATHTVYVATFSDIAVFDANTCNATVQSGCSNMGSLPADALGNGPNGFEGSTRRTAPSTRRTMTKPSRPWDLAGCCRATWRPAPARPPAPCRHTLTPMPLARPFGSSWTRPSRSVYVVYQEDDALAVVDTNVCNGSDLAGCATLHPQFVRAGAGMKAWTLTHRRRRFIQLMKLTMTSR